MPDPRSIEVLARRMVHELSERIHALEHSAAFRHRRFAFNDLSDSVLSVLLVLMTPWNAFDYSATGARIREVSQARQSLNGLRMNLIHARDRGWVASEQAETMLAACDELGALMLILTATLRRDQSSWKVGSGS